jgi:hypothetical protein
LRGDDSQLVIWQEAHQILERFSTQKFFGFDLEGEDKGLFVVFVEKKTSIRIVKLLPATSSQQLFIETLERTRTHFVVVVVVVAG